MGRFHILLALALGMFGVKSWAADLEVEITDFRSSSGVAGVALFKQEEGFPDQSEKALARQVAEIKNGQAKVRFLNLDTGTYAISVLHDENNDGKMNKNFLGVPREGFGASNDPRPKMRAPKFDEARFELRKSFERLNVKMNY